MEPYLLAQLPLRADAEAIANDEHPRVWSRPKLYCSKACA
jgi:hypothetical protein